MSTYTAETLAAAHEWLKEQNGFTEANASTEIREDTHDLNLMEASELALVLSEQLDGLHEDAGISPFFTATGPARRGQS